MVKPLNWMLSGASANRVTSRILRNRLTLTTILAVSPFLGYGRSAYAACDSTGPSTYACSGTIPGAIIAAPNANVSTLAAPPFVATTDGLVIIGPGDIRFTDNNASSITNTGYGAGLSVGSLGDVFEGADGAVTIITNGTITGQKGDGIYAYNDGSGDLSITVDGDVTGMDSGEFSVASDGIYAVNYGNNLTINTGVQSTITGNDNAIDARNYGAGNLEITVEGKAKSYDYDGIFARNGDPFFGENEAVDLKITVGAQAVVDGGGNGIQAQNYGNGNLDITVNGSVTGQGYDGIHAVNYGDNLIITTGASSNVVGNAAEGTDSNGIDARNYGEGYLKITANGTVFGNINDGIFARNYGTDLTIETGAQSVIKGGGNGIGAYNYGDGNLTITANGVVGGYSDDGSGIKAINNKGWVDDSTYADGHDLTISTGAQSVVTGKKYGIEARNYGDGDLKITALGQVTGKSADGIYALLDGSEGYDVEIITGVNSTVTGARNGIYAQNYGYGKLSITAYGAVTGVGDDGDGIKAYNSSNGTYLSIVTGTKAITGGDDGIQAENRGYGDLTITTNGVITGQNGNGITALNSSGDFYNPSTEEWESSYGRNLTITTNAAVTGKQYGIFARNSGDGDLTITANADVTGQNTDGIYAYNFYAGVNLTITTAAGSNVDGASRGIYAHNYGSGDLKIATNGAVTGRSSDGIFAINEPTGQDFTITTGPGSVITGDYNGIRAWQRGTGEFNVTINGAVTGNGAAGLYAGSGLTAITIGIGANGLVQGDDVGIYASSGSEQLITITNDGTVRNLSQLASDLAIKTKGGATSIDNPGAIIGRVELSDFSDSLDNDGLWVTSGDNHFGAGEDEVTNRGTLFGADDATVQEETVLHELEAFNNDGGLISLIDGQAGDVLRIQGDGGPVQYTSTDGHLSVDSILGPQTTPDRLSDELLIAGNVTGTTTVHVNVLNTTGANLDGIPVIEVEGTTAAGDFVLAGPLTAGFYTWDMRYDAIENWHELFTSGVGVGASEFAAGLTSTQDIWFQTAGTVLQRQADLRVLLAGDGVTPVADFGEPVAPTPIARITPGFWFSGLGAYLKRDDEQDGFTLDRKQTIWGGVAGFDFGTQTVSDAMLFGVFGGYMTSDLKFQETNTEWNYDGPTIGAYATYLDHAFFVDATIKADFLNISIDPDDLAPDADDSDTDAVNIGGRIDTGYKFGEDFFIEPQASLAVVYTDIDDVDVFGGTVEFDNETSVRGRLGARIGIDHEASDATVYTGDVIASVWETFTGDNNATIADPALPNFGVSDDPGATMGDVSLGFSVASPDGWSGFLRGNYQFANDYDAYSGNAGLRYAW